MSKVLVIHGAGMNMRGKVQLDIFGPMTLPEYDEHIRGYAKELGVEVEIFHSNIEGEIVNKLYTANDQGFDAACETHLPRSTCAPSRRAIACSTTFKEFPLVRISRLSVMPVSDAEWTRILQLAKS